MHTGHTLLLLSVAVTACAGSGARQPAALMATRNMMQPTNQAASRQAASRLGPPSRRGLGLRRVDRARPSATDVPLAFY